MAVRAPWGRLRGRRCGFAGLGAAGFAADLRRGLQRRGLGLLRTGELGRARGQAAGGLRASGARDRFRRHGEAWRLRRSRPPESPAGLGPAPGNSARGAETGRGPGGPARDTVSDHHRWPAGSGRRRAAPAAGRAGRRDASSAGASPGAGSGGGAAAAGAASGPVKEASRSPVAAAVPTRSSASPLPGPRGARAWLACRRAAAAKQRKQRGGLHDRSKRPGPWRRLGAVRRAGPLKSGWPPAAITDAAAWSTPVPPLDGTVAAATGADRDAR